MTQFFTHSEFDDFYVKVIEHGACHFDDAMIIDALQKGMTAAQAAKAFERKWRDHLRTNLPYDPYDYNVAHKAENFSDEIISALCAAKMSNEHDHLNSEME